MPYSVSNESEYTPIDDIASIVSTLRENLHKNGHPTREKREEQLKQFIAMFEENTERWDEAIRADLKQNRLLTFSERDSSVHEAKYQLSHLKQNMATQSVKTTNPICEPGSAALHPEPLGVVLIISPWNYPISLLAKPLSGAIAAGNAVVLKPSEICENVSNLYIELVPKYMDPNLVSIIAGGKDVCSEVLKQRFDYIFYTGSSEVGKIVMTAAAKHLTPVTLELGGKSPCYVDEHADFKAVFHRATWGKWLNVGQTCVAPDYFLVNKKVKDKFVEGIKHQIEKFYGENPQESPDYSRVINERHVKRISGLLEDQKDRIVHGGKIDLDDRYIEPTIVLNPPLDSKLMTEEIFGPIMPVIEVENHEEAIRIINDREKPLALYAFSKTQAILDAFRDRTSSGGCCFNDTIVHILTGELQFGGVGSSGMGAYNGKATFDTFTHHKPILSKSTWIDPSIRYPPYTDNKMKIVEATSSMKMPKCAIM